VTDRTGALGNKGPIPVRTPEEVPVPWKEICPMDERVRFVALVNESDETFTGWYESTVNAPVQSSANHPASCSSLPVYSAFRTTVKNDSRTRDIRQHAETLAAAHRAPPPRATLERIANRVAAADLGVPTLPATRRRLFACSSSHQKSRAYSSPTGSSMAGSARAIRSPAPNTTSCQLRERAKCSTRTRLEAISK
jgi:hypothetical protein